MGANNMDDHFKNMPFENNLPVLMGLMSVWNVTFLGYPARAILPYCQVGGVRGGYNYICTHAGHPLPGVGGYACVWAVLCRVGVRACMQRSCPTARCVCLCMLTFCLLLLY